MNTQPSATQVNPWLIALTVMLPAFMEVLDATIGNVSFSHIAGSLAVPTFQATWVLTSYLIANAIMIPCAAWLGQRFGRKNVLQVCLLIFATAAFFGGLATSLPMLVLMRSLQGAAGGAFQPIAQSILLESFPKEKHGQAMAVYSLAMILAPLLGPVLGGWITDSYGWRWIFFLKLPAGLLAMCLIQRFIQDPRWIRPAHPARLDVIGFSFLTLWLGCQGTLLNHGQDEDWFGSHFIVLLTALAAVGLVGFVWRGLTTEKPLVDLRVFANYNFSLGVVLMFFAGITLYSLPANTAIFLQALLGYTSQQSGLTLIPRGLGALLAMLLIGRLAGKIPARHLIAGGFLAFGLSAVTLAQFSTELTPGVLFWPLLINGVSMSCMFVPLNTLVRSSLKPEQIGNASGILNLMRNVGASAGISLVTTFVARGAQGHQTDLAAQLTPYDTAYQSSLHTMTTTLSAHSGAYTAHQQALGTLYHTLASQASMLAFLDNFRVLAGICFVGFVGALLLKKAAAKSPVNAR